MRGAALIISVLVLTTILLGLATLGSRAFWNEQVALTALSHKKRADYLALACMEEAIFRLGSNEAYLGGETLTIDSDQCFIRPVTSSDDTWTLITEAEASGQNSYYTVVLSSLSPVVIEIWVPRAGP